MIWKEHESKDFNGRLIAREWRCSLGGRVTAVIHRYIGYGDELFLTVHGWYQARSLGTSDLAAAKTKAWTWIRHDLDAIDADLGATP